MCKWLNYLFIFRMQHQKQSQSRKQSISKIEKNIFEENIQPDKNSFEKIIINNWMRKVCTHTTKSARLQLLVLFWFCAVFYFIIVNSNRLWTVLLLKQFFYCLSFSFERAFVCSLKLHKNRQSGKCIDTETYTLNTNQLTIFPLNYKIKLLFVVFVLHEICTLFIHRTHLQLR